MLRDPGLDRAPDSVLALTSHLEKGTQVVFQPFLVTPRDYMYDHSGETKKGFRPFAGEISEVTEMELTCLIVGHYIRIYILI